MAAAKKSLKLVWRSLQFMCGFLAKNGHLPRVQRHSRLLAKDIDDYDMIPGFGSAQISQNMLGSTNSDPDFMSTIITGDEFWMYGYDLEPVIFLTIKIRREHLTLPHSSAACH